MTALVEQVAGPRLATVRLLRIVFFFSGAAALTYQVAWQRQLTLYYGVGPISTTLVITVFLAGLGIGSLVGARLATVSGEVGASRRLRWYLAIEIATGVFGCASPWILEAIGTATAGASYPVALLWMVVFLAIPTVLMGTTLPLLMALFEDLTPDFTANVASLYFVNTLGAALGALVAGWIVVAWFGLAGAAVLAGLLSFVLAGLVALWVASAGAPVPVGSAPVAVSAPQGDERGLSTPVVHGLVVLTGFMAIGYELAWFRIIAVLVKASPYAFATSLAVYLLGIALGSRLLPRVRAAARKRKLTDVDLFFGLHALLAATTVAWLFILRVLGGYPGMSNLLGRSFLTTLHPPAKAPRTSSLVELGSDLFGLVDVAFWPLVLMLPGTVLLGLSFPLVTSITHRDDARPESTVSRIYASTILGNALGGIVTGFVLLPLLGTGATLTLFAVAGALFLLGMRRPAVRTRSLASAALVVGLALAWVGGSSMWANIHEPARNNAQQVLLIDEGVDGVVATFASPERTRTWIGGLSHGARPGHRFTARAIDVLAHVRSPERVLVIGFGSGSTVEALLADQRIRELVIVELNSTLMDNMRRSPELSVALADPRVQLVIDDGRRYLNQHDESFDVISTDPLRTASATSNNLYSAEFFELVRSNLTDGGAFLLWTDEFAVVPRTLATAFPYVIAYDTHFLAGPSALAEDPNRRADLLSQLPGESRSAVVAEFQDIIFTGDGFGDQLDDGPINRDLRPRTEYYLSRGSPVAGGELDK